MADISVRNDKLNLKRFQGQGGFNGNTSGAGAIGGILNSNSASRLQETVPLSRDGEGLLDPRQLIKSPGSKEPLSTNRVIGQAL